MKRILGILTLCATLFGCQKAADDAGADAGTAFVTGFAPPAPADGYKRYVTPAIKQLQPGQDLMFCQWIDVADIADVDVIDVRGYQSATGHHAVLYSSSENEPVGTSRECTTDDMVSVEFLGGIGGEGGGNAAQLPPGVVFRKGKGRTLMANTHYLNTTDSVLDVQSVLDVKMAAPSAVYKPAGMAVINYLDFKIPPNSPTYAIDAYCTWPTETSLVMWSNHMHSKGVSTYSEVTHVGGEVERMATDTTWLGEQAFNPTWTHWDLGAPRVIHAGDQVHINCTWSNPTASMVRFPDEMCDAVGFYLEGTEQIVCDGAPAP